MEQIGVEALVEGLMQFKGDMGDMQSSFESVAGSSTLLERALGVVSDALGSFGEFVVNIAEVTLGVLLRDAVMAAIDYFNELVSGVIEAGNEFQTLQLRLENINISDMIQQGKDYTAASQEAVDMTQQQLEWIQKLAASTPYDATDIANVYTLARSYGFADDMAQQITESISNFAAGMGLGNQEIQRIIINFGQMVQQGKITTREMTDLARGAFVPVNDIMQRVTENMQANGGIAEGLAETISKLREKLQGYQEQLLLAEQRQSEFTDKTSESVRMANQLKIDELKGKINDITDEIGGLEAAASGTGEVTQEMFDKLKKAGLPAEEFIKAFIDTVGERFPEASKRMARTMQGALDNLQDLFKSVLGLNAIKPVFDVLGGAVADFVEKFQSPENWSRFTAAAQQLGTVLAEIFTRLLGLAPGAQSMIDGLIGGIEGLASWLAENQDSIVQWAADLAMWIRDEVVPAIRDQLVPFIRDQLVPAVKDFISFIWDHREDILAFFSTMADFIINQLVPFIADKLIPAVQELIGWLTEHWGDILPWLEKIAIAFVAFEIIQTIAKWVLGLVAAFIGLVVGIIGFVASVWTAIQAGTVMTGVILAIIANLMIFKFIWETLQAVIETGANILKVVLQNLFADLADNIARIKQAIADGNWFEVGKQIILAIVEGVRSVAGSLFEINRIIMESIGNTLGYAALDFYNFGANIIYGIINGIQQNSGALSDALWNVAQQAWDSFTSFWDMQSPSGLGEEGGQNIVAGIEKGIMSSIGVLQGAMQSASMAIVAPLAQAPSVAAASVASAAAGNTTNNATTNNFNLAINSSADTEPIMQDFSMMQSLAGG